MKSLLRILAAAAFWLGSSPGMLVQAVPQGFQDEGVAEINRATGFSFAPKQGGGHMMLVAGKKGNLFLIPDPDKSSDRSVILDISSRVCSNGERGLQSVLAHPDFKNKPWLYLYYAHNKNGNCAESKTNGPVNRLSRFTMKANNQVDKSSEVVLFETSSLGDDIHNGGDMAFGKDGFLYVSVGDAGNREDKVSQKRNMLLGSMIRITDTGGIPNGNPFTAAKGYKSARCNKTGQTAADTVCEEIYAYGLRNPFRMSMDPNTNGNQVKLYWNDVGGGKWEETNHLKAGKNYGWPIREGPCEMNSNTRCAVDGKFEDPIYWYAHKSVGGAAVGITFIPNGVWPDKYNNKLLFADHVFGKIFLLNQNNGNKCRNCSPPRPGWTNSTFHNTNNNPVTVTFGPYENTQALYYTTRGAGIKNVRRIVYKGGDNRAPNAKLLASRTKGMLGVSITFDGSTSSDPDGDDLEYTWDFGDGSDEVKGKDEVSHTFQFAGEYQVSLKVEDPSGAFDMAYEQITVGAKPVVTMTSPMEGDKFAVGDTFTLIGSAVDGNGNAMQDGALTWEVLLHHNTHTHPFMDPTTGNFLPLQKAPAPEDFEASTNSHLEVILTATDDSGVQGKVSRIIEPKKVTLDFDSTPQGLDLILDDFRVTTPVEVISWQNHNLRVEAPDQGEWIFMDWSHGADQNHVITVPKKDRDSTPLYVATYKGPPTPVPTPLPTPLPTLRPTLAPTNTPEPSTLSPTEAFAPKVDMLSPKEGDKFAVGDIFQLIASAVDGNGNPMQDETLTWEVRLYDNKNEYRPFLEPTSGNIIELEGAPPPKDFEAATSSYLEVILTATDASTGKAVTISRTIQPKKVKLEFDSSPQGFELILDNFTVTTPIEITSWQNHGLQVGAPDQDPWMWSSWSHGAAQFHTIQVPKKQKDVTPLYFANFTMPTPVPTPAPTPEDVPDTPPPSVAPTPSPTRLNSPTKLPTIPTATPTALPTLQPTPSSVEGVTVTPPSAGATTATTNASPSSSSKDTLQTVSKVAFPIMGVIALGLIIGLLRKPKARAPLEPLEPATPDAGEMD